MHLDYFTRVILKTMIFLETARYTKSKSVRGLKIEMLTKRHLRKIRDHGTSLNKSPITGMLWTKNEILLHRSSRNVVSPCLINYYVIIIINF